MSMDEMLLQELYGSQQVAAEEQIKQAQIQLVEAVAAEAGVDLNELSDDELSKFAHYVLSDEDEDEDEDEDDEKLAGLSDMYSAARAQAGQAYDYAKSNPGKVGGGAAGLAALLGGAKMLHSRKKRRAAQMMEEKGASYEDDVQTKLAEADMIGRQMARSYVDELSQINDSYEENNAMNNVQIKVASAMSHIATAWQSEMFGDGAVGALRSQLGSQEKTASLANAGYIGLAKVASYSPEAFAQQAELRAAEILAAYGVNPETLEDIQPSNVKLSSFPGVNEAANREEAGMLDEYNQMLDTAAMHIIENLLD
jgi:hypothetical protein